MVILTVALNQLLTVYDYITVPQKKRNIYTRCHLQVKRTRITITPKGDIILGSLIKFTTIKFVGPGSDCDNRTQSKHGHSFHRKNWRLWRPLCLLQFRALSSRSKPPKKAKAIHPNLVPIYGNCGPPPDFQSPSSITASCYFWAYV